MTLLMISRCILPKKIKWRMTCAFLIIEISSWIWSACCTTGSWFIVYFFPSPTRSITVTLKNNNSIGRNLTLKQRGVFRLGDLSTSDKRSIDFLKSVGGCCDLTEGGNDAIGTPNSPDLCYEGGDYSDSEPPIPNTPIHFLGQYDQSGFCLLI